MRGVRSEVEAKTPHPHIMCNLTAVAIAITSVVLNVWMSNTHATGRLPSTVFLQ